MRWTPGSGNADDIEDLRERGGGGGFGGRGVGLGGVLVLMVLSLIFGRDLVTPFLGGGAAVPASAGAAPDPRRTAAEQPAKEFMQFVITDVQDTWTRLLPAQTNVPYQRSKLVLFRDVVESACGAAESASGPFYCPGDAKVYLDLSFFEELRTRFRAGGEFAQAYVIAHEIGHHIQNLTGIERKVRRGQRANPAAANQLSVRMELQADCLAGVWGHSTAERNILESGDVESGLNAAAAIGDDRIQRMAGRAVNPESFTHGSSAQRAEWFRRGLETGRFEACDTFGGR
jgi:predicted metalloprotease